MVDTHMQLGSLCESNEVIDLDVPKRSPPYHDVVKLATLTGNVVASNAYMVASNHSNNNNNNININIHHNHHPHHHFYLSPIDALMSRVP